jgi:hypothetical protein
MPESMMPDHDAVQLGVKKILIVFLFHSPTISILLLMAASILAQDYGNKT